MKVIIAGSRSFNNYNFLKQLIERLDINITEIVCGDCYGADLLGKQWAEENNIPITHFPAQWQAYGRAAGPIRNKQMAEYADYLIAFWDGKSAGTKNMINEMKKINKHGSVFLYENRL